ELRDLLAQEVRLLQQNGHIHKGLDPDVEASGLLAWVNGLAIDAIIQGAPLDAEQQEKLLRRYLGSLG
ncbi:MAG: TetR family transcriptional regulator C-terminal domain-containing protein, partial [Thermostichus sp. BF3_bins_97]